MTTAITISIKYAYLLFLVKKVGVNIPNDVRNATITGNSKKYRYRYSRINDE